ncbi:hypothetical protein GQ600_17173 [Phytophthora cactorum]|nr:hypothetical protein GQ600_17173 [Phytophthora cactorum]
MKFFAPLVVGVIAFLSSQVDANGVCYDPNHGTGMDASSVQADMKTIASHACAPSSPSSAIRKWPHHCGCRSQGDAGCSLPSERLPGADGRSHQGCAGRRRVRHYGRKREPGGRFQRPRRHDQHHQADQVASARRRAGRHGAAQHGGDRTRYLSGWWDLVNNCDLLGVNAHPFFTLGTTADTAIQVLNNQWQTMCGRHRDVLQRVPAVEQLHGRKVLLPFFDTPYRHEQYEQTFGLVSYDSQDKFGMSVQQSNQEQQTPSTEAPTNQQQTTDAPIPYSAANEAPTQPPTEAPTQPQTEVPTQPPTEAPTAAPTPEATPVPTETPTIYQNSGSADYNTTTSGSSEITSVSSSGDGADSSNSKAASESSDSEQHQQTGKTGVQQSEQTTQQTTQDATPTGTNSQPQSQDNVQQANTQSSDSTSTTPVILGIAGGACAALVAFGFIYQTRKRAAGWRWLRANTTASRSRQCRTTALSKQKYS